MICLVQELKDRKKIRFLLSVAESGRGSEDQVTYFKERLDKRLVKIGRVSGPQDLVPRSFISRIRDENKKRGI